MATVESDHKPVSCLLDVQVAVINEAARRWEYGRFLRTDPEALTMQKQINIVPETVVHMNNVVLVNRTKATLEISNESAEETALFSIHCEGEPIGSLSQNQLFERKHGTCGLPFWLQVRVVANSRNMQIEVMSRYLFLVVNAGPSCIRSDSPKTNS